MQAFMDFLMHILTILHKKEQTVLRQNDMICNSLKFVSKMKYKFFKFDLWNNVNLFLSLLKYPLL